MARIYGYNNCMTTVGIAEAKNMLPELIRAVEAGEQVVITRHGVPVAQIGPPPAPKRKVILGGMEGQIRFKPGWNEAITEEELLGSRL